MPTPAISGGEASPGDHLAPSTPRRSTAVRRAHDGTSPRRASGNKPRTPNSPLDRMRSSTKKPESTLLGDFLLGRPSPNRVQRKSLEAARADAKLGTVNRSHPQGAVRERVKEWQKANAAIISQTTGPIAAPESPLFEDLVANLGEGESLSPKNNIPRPSRPMEREGQQPAPRRDLAKSAPKKRVISDDHWVKRAKDSSPAKSTPKPFSAISNIPNEFAKTTSKTLSLESKIDDWTHQVYGESTIIIDIEASLSVSKENKISDVKRKPTSSKNKSSDDGIRPLDEGFEANGVNRTSSKDKSFVEDIRWKPVRGERRRYSKEHEGPEDRRFSDGKSHERSIKNGVHSKNIRRISTPNNDPGNEKGNSNQRSPGTPTHRLKSHRNNRETTSASFDDIPVGSSAFSVLDIPVGVDAGSIKPPKPQRNPSLSAVPKVLKKVYNEGMKMVHDTVDPPRSAQNSPQSIESWLESTSDPFVHHDPVELLYNDPYSGSENHTTRTSDSLSKVKSPGALRGINDAKRSASDQHLGGENVDMHQIGQRLINKDHLDVESGIESRSDGSVHTSGLRRRPARRDASSPTKASSRISSCDILENTSCGRPNVSIPTKSSQVPPVQRLDSTHLTTSISDHGRAALQKPEESENSMTSISDDGSRMRSPRLSDLSSFDVPVQNSTIQRRGLQKERPTVDRHRLSTIVSVEPLSTLLSQTETASEVSQSTITQPRSNQSAVESAGPCVAHWRANHSGVKRHLTKHSDLMSILSLPDTSVQGRSKSIRSARSVRTARSRLDRATISDLLRELSDDEVKYMRELKTLVDGVVPVLLTYVLSKPDKLVSKGLFTASTEQDSETSLTKAIVDMGIALERLKNLHNRIPLEDLNQFIQWGSSAHKVYEDYLRVWRMGFKDIVVNLAPASTSLSQNHDSLIDGMDRNAEGDIVNTNGERVDVAYLLKRPLVRIKYLAKAYKGFRTLKSSEAIENADHLFQELLATARRRTEEEKGRQEDILASNTDPTRARDLRTLLPLDGIMIDRSRQVRAKDYFDLNLHHSSGQRMVCQVELLLRDKPNDKGDVLVCEVDTRKDRWLLIAPIELDKISARKNEGEGQFVVMIRGTLGAREWREMFVLTAENDDIALEWVQMLGTVPLPTPLKYDLLPPTPQTTREFSTNDNFAGGALYQETVEVPIGEKKTYQNTSLGSNFRTRRKPLPTDRSISAHSNSPGIADRGNRRSSDQYQYIATDITTYQSTPNSSGGSSVGRHLLEKDKTLSNTLSGEVKGNTYHPFDPERTPTRGVHPEVGGSTPVDLDTVKAQDKSPRSPDMAMPSIPKLRRRQPPAQGCTFDSVKTPIKSDFFLHRKPVPDSVSPKTSVSSREDGAPEPPVHTTPAPPSTPKRASLLSSFASKTRRSSSPLKHEYQPSDASGTSSESDSDHSENSPGSESDSSDDELEAVDVSSPNGLHGYEQKITLESRELNIRPPSLAPSNSASQAAISKRSTPPVILSSAKFIASLSCWSQKGQWDELWAEDCSIVVSAGLIEAFVLSASHSSKKTNAYLESSPPSSRNSDMDDDRKRPLIAQILTPVVPLRQSTALDIEIRSPTLASSQLKSTDCVRFRTRNMEDCRALYSAIHRARLENPEYKRLEQERTLNSFGGRSYKAAIGGNRRRSWFGRQKSYRASTRAPSATTSDESSKSFTSAILGRLRSGSGFNIENSSIHTNQGASLGSVSGAASLYASSSDASGLTPPRTPSNPSIAATGATNPALFKTSDLKIRLYFLETASKWADLGAARLTVTQPPFGMRQASSLFHGVEKRIIVTAKQHKKRKLNRKSLSFEPEKSGDEFEEDMRVLLDVVLGARCFSRQGVVGIAMNIWEDIVGDNGEIGSIGAVGGVSGKTRKYMFQCSNAAQAMWIYTLVGGGGRG